MRWEISPITRHHDRASFSCGEPALDEYLQRYARQNQEQDIGRTWVACSAESNRVVGFYTLSAASVSFENLPTPERKKLPRYPVPVAHLGRLGVDARFRGLGLGETLLMHAMEQVARASDLLAVRAIEVRAKTKTARAFYRRYQFVPLLDDANHLYLSIKIVRRLFVGGSSAVGPD